MQQSLQGQVAIVTGGGSGIGLAIAKALLSEGVHVILTSRRQHLVESEAVRLGDTGAARVVGIGCDVRDKTQVQALVASVLAQFGRIDILVNNAGFGIQDSLAECSESEWDRVMDTNVKGAFLCAQAVLPSMMAAKSGYILNIASQAAKYGYANAGPYCASKFALVGFAKALQEEVRSHGIRVHNLHPALVQVPAPASVAEQLPGWLQTEDLAEAALYVLKQPRRVFIEDLGLIGA